MEKPHKNLEAWKQSMDLVVEVYKTTKGVSASGNLRHSEPGPKGGGQRSE